MKKLFLLWIALLTFGVSFGQSITNYAFSYSFAGSLEDMSSGTTSLLTGNNDDNGSAVTNIGFTFIYMGVPYTQFSVNSNGQMRLGATAVGGSAISSFSAGVPILAPMAGDNEVNNGIVYKIVGTAPNRILVVQWTEFYANWTDITGSGNMQALLYEGTGKIDFIFGNIYNSSTSSVTKSIFISASNTATTAGYVTVGATPTFTPAATPVTNTFAASVPIANLASSAQGSRTVYTWTPPTAIPTAPTNLTFSAITATGMTLNWTDSPDELSYAILRSTDGINYSSVASVAANTVTYPATGLLPSTLYYWKVAAMTEAQAAELSGSQTTNPALVYYWVGTTGGTWNTPANWNTAADGSGSTRTVTDATDIMIVDGDGTVAGGPTTINVDVASFTLGQFKVTSNTNLTLQSSTTTTRTITIAGNTGVDFEIEAGSTLNLNNATMAVAFAFTGTGNTGLIAGTYNAAGSTSNVINTTGGTGTLFTIEATGVVNNSIVGSSGCLTGSVATLSFANGSNYTHGNYTTSNGYIPLATWGASSNIFITGGTGSTAISNAPGQTLGNFTYNSATSTSTCSAFTSSTTTVIQGNLNILASNTGKLRVVTTGTLTINGDLNVSGGLVETSNNTGSVNVLGNINVSGGTLDVAFASSPKLRVAGNFVQTGGNIIQTVATGILECNGTTPQTFTVLPGAHGTNVVCVRINNPSGVILTNDFLIRNLTVSNGNLGGTGNLIYNGTNGLLTYNGTLGMQLATATEFPAVNGPSSLTINNTSAAPNNIVGVPFSRRLTGTTGVLTLTSGILANPTYVLSVSNTAVAGISGGSATSYVAGGLERDLPASLVTGTTYNFPVGKSKLNTFALINPTTNAGGTVTILAEAFDGNCGGTVGALLQSLKTNRYWSASITSGGANFTNALIQLNDSTYGADAIAGSATINGIYDIVGGTAITATATSLTSTAPEVTTLPGFFVMANKAAPVLSNVIVTPSGNQCVNVSRAITVTVVAGGGAITGVVVNYSINGAAQAPITMTNVIGNDWTATIPTVTPANANVTWEIVATDANLLTATYIGTPYTDEPNTGLTASAVASATTVCANSPVDLTLTLSSPIPAAYTLPPAVTSPTVDEDLGNVTITEGATTILNNTSTRNTLDGTIGIPTGTAGSYSNYTAFGPYALTAGTTYSFSVSTLQNVTAYNNAIGIYIDYNRDGDFADAGENVYVSAATTSGAHTETGSFTVPATAFNGLTRMRVINNEGLVTGPTMTVGYGEYEEYMMNISSPNSGGGATVTVSSYEWSNGAIIVGTTNPLTVNPLTNTTYTGTAIVSSCPIVANNVSITVNPLPSTPTANNSTQCGVSVPACSVNSTSGAPSPTFSWYDVPTGGTPLAGITGSTYTGSPISTTTYFYVAEYDGTCESERVMVTATVGAAPALTVTTDQSVCNNSVATISVTSTLADFDSYVWTPVTDLFTDAACTTPYILGSNATTVYFKTTTAGDFTITCTSNNSGNGCSNVATTIVTVLPSSITAAAASNNFCQSGSTTISVTPATGYGPATFQWMESTDNVTFSDIVGANAISYTTPVITDTMYYKMVVELGATVCTESNVVTLVVINPVILTTTPDTLCGEGNATLSATSNTGTTIYWLQSASGPILGTGNSYTTALITDTTSYFVAATPGLSSASVGAANTAISALLSSQTTLTSGINFSVLSSYVIIDTIDIYPTVPVGSAFGIEVMQGATVIATYSGVTTVTGTTTTPVAERVPVGFLIPAGTGYQITYSVNPGTIRNDGGSAFPYTVPGVISLTSSTLSGYYYNFYNWKVSSGCFSAPSEIVAVVRPAPSITVSTADNIICEGSSTTVSATSSNDPDYTYSWQSGAMVGASQSVSPTYDSTFTVIATDNSGGLNDGCVTSGSVAIAVNPRPESISINVSDNSICSGETIDLFADAVSGDLAADTVFAESFENVGAIPTGWVAELDVDGNVTSAALTYPSTTSYPSGYNAYDGTYMVRFNSFSVSSGNSARLSNSTGFSTVGYEDITVNFAMFMDDGFATNADRVAVQFSLDGTTWYTAGTAFNRYSAAGDAWALKSVVLPDSLENLSTVYVAFLFTSAYGNDVYIDYVNIEGHYPAPATFAWTSAPAGFTSTQQNPAGVTPSATTQYIVTASNSYGCSLSADTTVTVNAIPAVYIGADQEICDTTTITLDAGNAGSTFNWSTGGASQTEDVLGSDLGVGANVVSVTVTTAEGCVGYDEVTITVTVCDGIEDPTMQISYYPNPATDVLNLDLSELPTGDYRFELLNMQGQKVMDRILINDGTVISVNLLDVAPGSYIINVSGNNNSFRNYLSIQE